MGKPELTSRHGGRRTNMYAAEKSYGPNNGRTMTIYCDGRQITSRTYSSQYSAIDTGWLGECLAEHRAAIAAHVGCDTDDLTNWMVVYKALGGE
jgi:hypothetical protein